MKSLANLLLLMVVVVASGVAVAAWIGLLVAVGIKTAGLLL